MHIQEIWHESFSFSVAKSELLRWMDHAKWKMLVQKISVQENLPFFEIQIVSIAQGLSTWWTYAESICVENFIDIGVDFFVFKLINIWMKSFRSIQCNVYLFQIVSKLLSKPTMSNANSFPWLR
jgi:hypothetical protein